MKRSGLCPWCDKRHAFPYPGAEVLTFDSGRKEIWCDDCREEAGPEQRRLWSYCFAGSEEERKWASRWLKQMEKRVREEIAIRRKGRRRMKMAA